MTPAAPSPAQDDPPGLRYRRRTARVLLLDDRDRLLLFRFPLAADRPGAGHCWITPGGGVDRGEGLREAAVRELREETGLVVAPGDLGPHVAMSSGRADFGWARGMFRDDFFLHRTAAWDVDTRGFSALERSQITAHRWWTLGELAAPAEPVYPLGVAELLTGLLAGRVTAAPVRLPWHH